MKFSTCFVSVLFLAAVWLTEAGQLRRGSSEESLSNRRQSRFGVLNIEDVMNGFSPVLASVIQSTIASNLNNVDLGLDFRQDLANLQVAPNCTSTASVDYRLGLLRGLNGFQIDSLELVPGSDRLDMSFLGLNGLSWSGIWNVRGSFDNDIEVDSEAVLSSDACGVPIAETSSGTVRVANPGLDFLLSMDGSSPSIFNLVSAVAQSINIQDAKFDFETILPVIDGLFGNNLELDLATIFEGLFSNAFLNQLLPLLVELLQNALRNGLPF
jgi:hypothetical protein